VPSHSAPHLWDAVQSAGRLDARWIESAGGRVGLAELETGSALCAPPQMLRGRSILIRTADQLPAALALLELDGLARRMVLCPPDVDERHLPAIAAAAEVEVVVGDTLPAGLRSDFVACTARVSPAPVERHGSQASEWVLLTSGTTGVPKLVVHSFETLTGPMRGGAPGEATVWSTFYDTRRYGGLQVFLVLSGPGETVADFLSRAGERGVTHISGTPSHWRAALMSAASGRIKPGYVRLSGEIADQTILDALRAAYPGAKIAHAFASTEAGVAFAVEDGKSGFPAALTEQRGGPVELCVEAGTLRIRSDRMALRYLGPDAAPLHDGQGFVDTGDVVERRGDRWRFAGRRGGVINIGGRKAHPEEIESVINRHPRVRMSLVKARRNPITGAVVVADVVAETGTADADALRDEILGGCKAALPRHMVPVALRFVADLPIAASGKLVRPHA
jgi:acyl-coenzyme A synthetase/AMP-(fatty) acid ligase